MVDGCDRYMPTHRVSRGTRAKKSKMSKVRVTAVAYIPPALFLHDAAGRARLAVGPRVGGGRAAAAGVLHLLGDCGGERGDSRGQFHCARIPFAPKQSSKK